MVAQITILLILIILPALILTFSTRTSQVPVAAAPVAGGGSDDTAPAPAE